MIFSRLFLSGLFLLAGIKCAPAGSDEINITNRFEYFRDSKGDISFSEIQNRKDWKTIQRDSLQFNFTEDVIWLRAALSDDAFEANRIISLEWKALDSGILYFPSPKNNYSKFETGDAIRKSLWTLSEAIDPSFKIPNERGTGDGFLYIRLESKSLISFPIRSMDEKAFHKKILLETGVTWLILGVCAVMFIVAVFYFLAFRLIEFFYYAIYVFSTAMWYNGQYGNAFHTLWPNATWWQSKAILFFIALGIASSFQFVRMFLETRKHTPLMDKILLVIGIVGLICALAILFTNTSKIYSRTVSLIYIFSVPLILGTGIVIYFKGEKRINFFLLCWGSYFVIGYASTWYFLGLIPYSVPVLHAAIFVFPIDLFFLLFNLLQKYQKLAGERNEILQRILTIDISPRERYAKSKLETVNAEESLLRLDKWMRQAKPYLDEKLDLEITSNAIGLNIQQTSELLNSRLGMSFRSYLNSFRIEEAKEILKSRPEMNVLSIAYATGFGSKSTFNDEFKKSTGMTPVDYRKKSAK